jgi:hypothetical protein
MYNCGQLRDTRYPDHRLEQAKHVLASTLAMRAASLFSSGDERNLKGVEQICMDLLNVQTLSNKNIPDSH